MIAIKDMEEMPNACTSTQEILGDIAVADCPLYNVCKHRDTIRVNYKPSDCPLVEIITCKDCKYYREDDDAGHCTNHTHGDIVFWCHDDYYCADAERRE